MIHNTFITGKNNEFNKTDYNICFTGEMKYQRFIEIPNLLHIRWIHTKI